jgi:membrane associated rhomboid family serine protease
MVAKSDRSLALSIIARLPWFSVLFIMLQLIVFASMQINDANATVFAMQNIDDSALRDWAFDITKPFRNAGANVISSLFVHAHASHLYSNIFPALIFLPFAEKRFGTGRVALWLSFGHITALAGALVAHSALGQTSLVAGMSGALLAVVTFTFAARWRGHTGIVCAGVCGFYCFYNLPAAVAHIPPVAGSYLLALLSSRNKSAGPK